MGNVGNRNLQGEFPEGGIDLLSVAEHDDQQNRTDEEHRNGMTQDSASQAAVHGQNQDYRKDGGAECHQQRHKHRLFILILIPFASLEHMHNGNEQAVHQQQIDVQHAHFQECRQLLREEIAHNQP